MRTCECGNPVFGTDKKTGIGYCGRCQWKRTDKKQKKLKIKITQVKDFSKVPDFGFNSQTEMFFYMWDNAKDAKGNVTCPYTGQRLNQFFGHDIWFSCFMHVLPKGRYTYWKLNPANIRIAFPMFHMVVDQGTLDARKEHPEWKFDVWDREVIELKEEYRLFKIKNLLG